MLFKNSAKKYFIVLVFLSEGVAATVQATDIRTGVWDTYKEQTNSLKDASWGVTVNIPFDIFRSVKTLPPSVTFTIKKTEIELTSVVEALDLVTKSLHDNLPQFDTFFYHIRSKKNNLCKSVYFDNLSICNDEQTIRRFNTSLSFLRNSVEQQTSDLILYPQTYDLDKSFTEDDFKITISLLDTDCPQTCSNTDIAKAIRHSSQEQYRQLYNKIQNKDPNCQKSILEAFTKSFTNEEFPLACQDKKNKNHLVCKNMLKDIDVIGSRFKELVELIYGSEILQTTEAQAYCLECKLQSSSIRNLNDFLDILDEENNCLDLNPKAEKMIYSSTGLKPYTVKKEADGSYSISLTMQFSSAADYDGFTPSDQVPDNYMQKAQECLQQAHQKMTGPNNEKLQIVINKPIDNPSICEANAINYILIGASSERANNKKYNSDIDCPSITYQVLHLLGLDGEFQEKQNGFYVQPETGNITAASEVDSHQVEELQEQNHRIQLDKNCRITLSKSIESD